ncbi:hypothetical protein F5X68DRAFT_218784 [Plectosphaerella plurivora]|uniref:Uncharacterized protein n=1 Tax=Plectosphaerella plurivora TaxID=936078 RepID=A0A9P9A674_9PEZI|nr:hypothetical protein F5X68DRAFT_218784 [Plectosphaerella plurivora]
MTRRHASAILTQLSRLFGLARMLPELGPIDLRHASSPRYHLGLFAKGGIRRINTAACRFLATEKPSCHSSRKIHANRSVTGVWCLVRGVRQACWAPS